MEKNTQTYEEETDVVVGLDIGTTKVVAVVGCRDRETGKVRILGYGKTESLGVVRGTVMNIERTTEAIKVAVAEASKKSDVEIGEVYVGIAGQHIRSFTQSFGFVRPDSEQVVTREEIEKMKKNYAKVQVEPGKQILHVIPQTFNVDGVPGIHEEDFKGMTGSKIEVTYNVITADTAAMRAIKRCVEDADLELKGFVLEPLVSAEAVLDATDKEAGVVLVDIGGGTTDVAIFMNGILCHTAVIPLAGNAITSDVRQGCNILPRQAEALKVRFGSALPSQASDEQIVSIPAVGNTRAVREISLHHLAQIIHARVEEIFDAVSYEIGNSSCNPESFIGGVVLTGGGSKMKHIDKVCEYVTHQDTRLATPIAHLTADSPKELNDPIFATSIGLVIFGIRCEEERFLYEDHEEEKEVRKEKPAPEGKPDSEGNPESDGKSEAEGKPESDGKPAPGADSDSKKSPKRDWGFISKLKDWIVDSLNDELV